MTALVHMALSILPRLIASTGDQGKLRFLEFFTANIRAPHTHRAHIHVTSYFLAWCSEMGVPVSAFDR